MGFYQRYEDQKFEAKEKLSVEIDPKPGEVSRFPPGVKPADLTRAEDSSEQIMGDAFKALESGTIDIAALSQANQSYKAKVEAEPEKSLSDISQELGPGKVGGDAVYGPPLPGLGGAQAPATSQECTVEHAPINSAAGTLPTDVVNNCAETGGIHDQSHYQTALFNSPPSGADDQSIDPRSLSGHNNIVSVLEGFGTCAADTIKGFLELIAELSTLTYLGALTLDHEHGTGWFGDAEDAAEFYRQVAEIKQELLQQIEQGLQLMAALDKYFASIFSSNATLVTLQKGINVIRRLIFTDAEWAAMAEAGKKLAQQMIDQFNKLVDEKGVTYAGGYLACEIGKLLIPGGVLLKAIRVIRRGRGGSREVRDNTDSETAGDDAQPPNGDNDKPSSEEAPKPPEKFDKDADGQPTPNGSPKQEYFDPEREFVMPGHPDAIVDYDIPNGMPNRYLPGSYKGVTRAVLKAAGVNKIDTNTYMNEQEVGKILSKKGYHVNHIDDPRNKRDSKLPNPELRPTDYVTKHRPNANPDFRIDGVIYDMATAETPHSLLGAVDRKVRGSSKQADHVIIDVPGGQNINEYLATLKREIRPGSDLGKVLNRVILVDKRTGRILTFFPR